MKKYFILFVLILIQGCSSGGEDSSSSIDFLAAAINATSGNLMILIGPPAKDSVGLEIPVEGLQPNTLNILHSDGVVVPARISSSEEGEASLIGERLVRTIYDDIDAEVGAFGFDIENGFPHVWIFRKEDGALLNTNATTAGSAFNFTLDTISSNPLKEILFDSKNNVLSINRAHVVSAEPGNSISRTSGGI